MIRCCACVTEQLGSPPVGAPLVGARFAEQPGHSLRDVLQAH